MAELPSGTVTFLFTDIEGSTRLWERSQDAMWVALDRHNSILLEAIEAHGGHHFKTIGDAFQVAFPDAPSAVSAALVAQLALNADTWGTLGSVRVRMAIHTGMAQPLDGDYLAPCLNRLSRLLSTGFGGQILLSQATQQLVRDHLSGDITIQDLGDHRLRDLQESERVFQLLHPDLPGDFPPLKSLERHPTNLPIQPTPLVGRESDLMAVVKLLRRNDVRLVTLTGVGGTGKTRLALQVAAELLEDCEDGSFFIDLAPLSDPNLVLSTIATTLGVRESAGQALLDTLVAYLADKRLLLVIDNFEQVLEAASLVADLLQACPNIKVLATSRARLALQAEHEYPVPPLPVPAPGLSLTVNDLLDVDAVQLFVQRAGAARSGFALTDANANVIAKICVNLEGLPLAIELAAARVRVLSPDAILQRLDRRLKLLTGGARDLPERQQTLRAAIEWSYGLLSDEEKVLFRRLAVFAGGFDLEAAEAVISAPSELELDVLDGITALVDQSLVRSVEGSSDSLRFAMLESLREFGLQRLGEVGEIDIISTSHANYYMDLVGETGNELNGLALEEWLDHVEEEYGNMRAALSWSQDSCVEVFVRLVSETWRFWLVRGHLSEGRRWLDQALRYEYHPTAQVAVNLLRGAGALAGAQGDYSSAELFLNRGLEMASTADMQNQRMILLNSLGSIALSQGKLESAEALYLESLRSAEYLGRQSAQAKAIGNLGAIEQFRGHVQKATKHYEDSLAIWRSLQDKGGVAMMLFNLQSLLASSPEHIDRARAYGEESLRLSREIGDKQGMAYAQAGLGLTAEAENDLQLAEQNYHESLSLFRGIDDRSGIARALSSLGLIAIDRGVNVSAARQLEEALCIFVELGEQDSVAYCLEGQAIVAAAMARNDTAVRFLSAAAALRDRIEIPAPTEIQPRLELLTSWLRSEIGDPEFNLLLAKSQLIPIEHVIAEALELSLSTPVDVALQQEEKLS